MREKFIRDVFVLILSCSFCVPSVLAQTKKKITQKPAIKDTVIINKQPVKEATLQQSTLLTKKTETIIVIDPKTGKPIAGKSTSSVPTRKPDTIIYLEKGARLPSRNADSVIVLKNSKQHKGLLKNQPVRDTPQVVFAKANEVCDCVSMSVKAPDTLAKDNYLNYSFILKNNCRDIVYISSSAFSFTVFNKNGTPTKVLRQVTFAKQYKYSDYVPLSPKEEFHFEYGDDAFFQYDLRQGYQYKFTFLYRPGNQKLKSAPKRAYLCNEYKEKLISIK